MTCAPSLPKYTPQPNNPAPLKQVGFSLTYANLLLQTLPDAEGVVVVNTGVGGTGFHASEWK